SSNRSIDPVTSANSAVTVMRSPSSDCVRAGSGAMRTSDLGPESIAGGDAGSRSAAPHCPQNLNEGGFSNPHFGHLLPNGAAQLPQNFMPCGFSVPQLEHVDTYSI